MDEKITSTCEWLRLKFEAWRCQKGVKKTLTEFAAYIGITEESLLSFWDGVEIPKGANLAKLGGTLGFEIYDILGIQSSLILDTLPHSFKLRYASAFTEYYETINAQSYKMGSPEAENILNELIEKYHLTKAIHR